MINVRYHIASMIKHEIEKQSMKIPPLPCWEKKLDREESLFEYSAGPKINSQLISQINSICGKANQFDKYQSLIDTCSLLWLVSKSKCDSELIWLIKVNSCSEKLKTQDSNQPETVFFSKRTNSPTYFNVDFYQFEGWFAQEYCGT